jgi:RNA polymerase primary sigma factor
MISEFGSNPTDWFNETLDRLAPLEVRRGRDWTPCKSDPFFFDCSQCEFDWSDCVLRTDPDLRIYHSYRRIGDTGNLASSGQSDPMRSKISTRVIEIIVSQGVPVPLTVLSRLLSSETDEDISVPRIESVVAATASLDVSSSGIVTIRDVGDRIKQWAGPWWAGLSVDTGQAIVSIQREVRASDRAGQHLLLKHYQALSLVKNCKTSQAARSTVDKIIKDDLDRVAELTGRTVHELVTIASSPDVTILETDLIDDGDESGQMVSRVLAALCADDLLTKTPDIDPGSEVVSLKSRIVELNYSLVVGRAVSYTRTRSLGFADLVQQGVLGMLVAIDKYDPYKGFQFSTYATWWIRQHITREIADKSRTVRMPVHVVEKLNKVLQALREHEQKHETRPSFEVLADYVEFDNSEVEQLLGWGVLSEQLDRDVHDRIPTRIIEEPSYPATSDPAEILEGVLDGALIAKLMESLQQRERKVISMRFGLDDGRYKTLEEIGQHMRLTRERIRQIERKALGRMRSLAARITFDPRLARDEDDSVKKWASSVALSPTNNKVSTQPADAEPGMEPLLARGLGLASSAGLFRTRISGDDRVIISDPENLLEGKMPMGWTYDRNGILATSLQGTWFYSAQSERVNKSRNVVARSDALRSPDLSFISNMGIDVIDNLEIGGALWVVIGQDDDELSNKLRVANFQFKRKGGKATGKRPAWYLSK